MHKKIRLRIPQSYFQLWLRNRDLNPNKQSQSLSCYRYTIPQYKIFRNLTAKIIIQDKSLFVKKKFNFFIIWFAGFVTLEFAFVLKNLCGRHNIALE